MNSDQPKSGVAQPADEALKKHGDQLQKPVDEAAGKQMPDNKGDEERAGLTAVNAQKQP